MYMSCKIVLLHTSALYSISIYTNILVFDYLHRHHIAHSMYIKVKHHVVNHSVLFQYFVKYQVTA
jgi:hypothetical protein